MQTHRRISVTWRGASLVVGDCMLDYAQADVPAALRVVRDEPASYDATPKPRERFAMTPLTVAHESRLSLGSRGVYMILAGFWWRTGECRITIRDLASYAHRSPSHVRRFVDELVANDVIVRDRVDSGLENIYRPSPTFFGIKDIAPTDSPALTGERTPAHRRAHPGSPVSAPHPSTSFNYKERENRDSAAASQPEYTASPPKPPTRPTAVSASSEKPRPKRSQLPADWGLNERGYSFALGKGWDSLRATAEAEKFAYYHQGRGSLMLDWSAAWRTWVTNGTGYDARRVQQATGTDGRAAPTPDQKARTRPGWSGYNHEGMAPMRIVEFTDE